MRQAAAAAAAAGLAAIAFAVATGDPEQPSSVALVIVAFAVTVGSLATLALAGPPPKRKRSAALRPGALRRGAAVGLVAGMVAFLRVIDGLTPITAGLVVLAFGTAEYVLAGRKVRSRR